MYRITAFRNSTEFNELFGIQEHGNGVKSRRNKILLQFLKHKPIWDYCRKHNKYSLFLSIRSMAQLKQRVLDTILDELEFGGQTDGGKYMVRLMDVAYFSSTYSTDNCYGIPSNGDIGFVRYVSHEKNRDGKVYRMRAGRFYKRLILESELGRALPEQVLNWLCEQFAEQWSSYVSRKLPHFTLNVDDDFRRIYSYGQIDDDTLGCSHEFNSCMMGDGQWVFYKNSVKAKAAYLTNDAGYVIARCVIFTEVFDEEGNKWRLAERQYSEYGSDLLKRCLVDSLIDAGLIDGYKQVGVDCHATNAYVDKDGKSLSHNSFRIKCDLNFSQHEVEAFDNEDDCRVLSYQDSFKYYDYTKHEAYNYEPDELRNIFNLDTTQCFLQGYKDEYHGYMCANIFNVFVGGEQTTCDYNHLEDFVDFRGYYIHKDDMTCTCPVCGEKMPDCEAYGQYGFIRNYKGTFCCSSSCRDRLERDYIDNHCFYDSIRGQYVDLQDDKPIELLKISFGNVRTLICSSSKLQEYIEQNRVTLIKYEDMVVPLWSYGYTNPQARFAMYLTEHTVAMHTTILGIVSHNKANGIVIEQIEV